MTGHLPPHNHDAEDSIIGALMVFKSNAVDALRHTLDPADFHQPKAAAIYDAAIRLHDRGDDIDTLQLETIIPTLDRVYVNAAVLNTPSMAMIPRNAGLIINASRKRRIIGLCADISDRAYETHTDVDELLASLDPTADRLLLPRNTEIAGLWELQAWTAARTAELEAQQAVSGHWLVPHILKPRWRVIVVAAEGVGKATFMRQLGLHAAAGVDPFDPSRRTRPISVLYVDVENADTTIMRQHQLANNRMDLIPMTNGNFHLWHREGGLDLRKRQVRAQFEAVLQRTRPELVLAGPMYKLFRRSSQEAEDQAATEFLQILDDLRVRYNFALVLEHHAPKGVSGGMREMAPFGSSVFLRWPEFGLALNDHGEGKRQPPTLTVDVERFRPDREPADWPDQIVRGSNGSALAWCPTWYSGRGRSVNARWTDNEWTYPT